MKIDNNINSNTNTIKNDIQKQREIIINDKNIDKNEIKQKSSEVDISIMNQLQQLKTESSYNKEKISRLKNEINSNQYSIDVTRLSKKIMEFEFQLQKLKD